MENTWAMSTCTYQLFVFHLYAGTYTITNTEYIYIMYHMDVTYCMYACTATGKSHTN